jgi:hypothetical protein
MLAVFLHSEVKRRDKEHFNECEYIPWTHRNVRDARAWKKFAGVIFYRNNELDERKIVLKGEKILRICLSL